MGKFAGAIGFGYNKEIETDIWDDVIEERFYYGDILSNRYNFNQADTLSGDLRINNQLSILGDDFLFEHLEDIRYVIYKNKRWIVSVEEGYPRITLTLGGLYNGQTPKTECNA